MIDGETDRAAALPDTGAAEGEQAEKPANDEYVTLAPDEEGDEQAPGEGEEADGDEAGGEEGGEGEEAQRRHKSRNQRRREKVARLEAEVAELRRRVGEPGDDAGTGSADDEAELDKDLKEPKETDFPNDYLAFERALNAFNAEKAARKAVRYENKRKEAANASVRQEKLARDRHEKFQERLTAVKDRIPDYAKVLKGMEGVQVRDDVSRSIQESPKGPLLAYYFGKNPSKLDELHRLSPLSAAREIGRLESRLRLPQPNTVTKAKAPVETPKGDTSATAKRDPSTLSNEAFRAQREAGKL